MSGADQVATAAPTRDPRTSVISLLRSTPRCCGSSRSFDASDSEFFVDRGVWISISGFCGGCLFVYLIWSVCRWWLWSCRRSAHYLGKRKLEVSYRQRLMLAALVAVGLTSLAVGTIGAQSVLDKSLRQATDSSRDLADKLNDVEDSTTSLSRYAGSISELSEFVQCDDSDLEDFLGEMADSFQEAAQEAAGSIEDTGKEADKWADRVAVGRRRLNLALLLVVAVVHVALMPSTAYGTALSRRWSLWVASRFAFLICCFLALAVAAEFAVGVELADFCRKPDQHFADVVRERGGNLGEEAQDLMIYYSTCEGENPLEDELSAALVAANSLSDTIDSLKATCEPTAVIDRIQFEVEASIQIIENDLTQQIQCAPINRDYQRVLHTATCRHSLRGLYFLAIVHAFVLAALYVFLYATNWVCETILLEEEFWLLPHPEIFTVASYRSNRAAPLTSVSSNDDDDDDDANDIDLEFENTRAVREVRI